MKKLLLCTLAAVLVTGAHGAFAGKKRVFVTIGTGGVTGVYYPAGGAVAKMVNAKRDTYGIRASVESTGGSVYNINAVLTGDLDLGIAQSDRQYQAWHGQAEWDGKPQKSLRSVFSLHPEIVTLIATDESGIATVADLKGKRVNIGNPGSGLRGNAIDVLTAAGIRWQEDLTAESLKASECPKMMQDGRIDAFFFTVGHPSGTIKEASSGKRPVHFVPVTGMDKLLSDAPYYAKAVIPLSHYPRATGDEDVASIGVVTTIVTSESVSDDVVYAVVKEVFDNLETFKANHPALGKLTAETMLDGLTAPLHPGAKKYFVEKKLIKE